jgi:hypothetical protein
MSQGCPGFASYRDLSNGQVEVSGSIPVFTDPRRVVPLVEAWEKFGSALERAASRSGVPVAWLVGIMMAESKGNPRACSPCSICNPSICASGAGMQCCAFGLMQFISQTANVYGTTPTEIVNNPSKAVEVAGELIADLADRFGPELPKIAAAYNAGGPRCSQAGTTFGWKTNDDYPMVVVQYANTFVELGLAPPAFLRPEVVASVFALVGVGVAVAIYTGKL